jgi:hypothetical protein
MRVAGIENRREVISLADAIYGVRVHPCSLRYGDESLRTAMKLALSPAKIVARISGGAGGMESRDVAGMFESFQAGFTGFRGDVVIGGTQMRSRFNLKLPIVGITEVAPIIARAAPEAIVIGVTPRLCDLTLIDGVGAMVADGKEPGKPDKPYITIVHPDLNVCLLLQYSADIPLKSWVHEWQTALRYMGLLRTESQPPFQSFHMFYNGGQETERELLGVMAQPHEPDNPWWTILLADSGRIAQQYAEDRDFRSEYADRLVVCDKAELRTALQDLGFTP